jgi:hypothetical protein
MIDALVWTARSVAALNVGLALLMLWGSSAGTGTRRESIAQWLGLLLVVGSLAAVVAAFRLPELEVTGPLRPRVVLMLMAALPALALATLPLSPQGSTPIRDAVITTAAFALPPLLLALAR